MFSMRSRSSIAEWRSERRMISHWSYWVTRGNQVTLHSMCGLTPEGSPHTIMDKIWECGAADEDAVTGYAGDLRVHDYVIPEVDNFMSKISALMPTTYEALIARHRRIVNGRAILIHNERWIARCLYGGRAGEAHARLCRYCEIGYGMLRIRLENFITQCA